MLVILTNRHSLCIHLGSNSAMSAGFKGEFLNSFVTLRQVIKCMQAPCLAVARLSIVANKNDNGISFAPVSLLGKGD